MAEKEIDISQKVNNVIKFGVPALIVLAVAIASIIWYMRLGAGDLIIDDAKVASSMVSVRTRASGTISEILVKDGDRVQAGQVLARIEVNVTEEQIRQLEQTVELSRRNLDQIRQGVTITTPVTSYSSGASSAEIARAASRADRMNQLYEMGAVSAAERDSAAAEYASLQASASYASSSYQTTVQPASPEVIANAEKAVKQAEAALEVAKSSSMATEIISNTSGIVYISEGVIEGAEVKPGQVVMSVGDADSLWIEAYVATDKLNQVKLGQLASYRVYRSRYQGTVTDISTINVDDNQTANTDGYAADAAAQQDNGKATVRISIPTEYLSELRPGQRAEVTFIK